MSESYLDSRVVLHSGDCREVIRGLPDASIDSVVTDPPYALVSIVKRFGKAGAAPAKHGVDGVYARASAGFMGQSWDTGETAFATEFWVEVLRVLKPGGHVVAFSGTRTYHRMVVAIEDAGFEIRDQLAWVYGSGFPKSHGVSRAIDDRFGWFDDDERAAGLCSHTAAQMAGLGTALKPAWEPIVLARRSLAGTVAETVFAHGTGAINIDGCRVETSENPTIRRREYAPPQRESGNWSSDRRSSETYGSMRPAEMLGRWPANVLHDGSDEVVAAFPQAPGQMAEVCPNSGAGKKTGAIYGAFAANSDCTPRADADSAARFFYSAKADAHDRVASRHPTVKPLDLMQWLCRLVTPKGGLVLDPFAGTGTTGEAAWREGFRAILVEREAAYCDDIRRRLRLADRPGERAAVAKSKGRAAVDHGPLFAAVGIGGAAE